jgi:hypothetical protein
MLDTMLGVRNTWSIQPRVSVELDYTNYAANKEFRSKPAACTCMPFAIVLKALDRSQAFEIRLELLEYPIL